MVTPRDEAGVGEPVRPGGMWPAMDGDHLGRGYEWPDGEVERAWCGRFRNPDGLRATAAQMPTGPHRDFLDALLAHRDGRTSDALHLVQGLLEDNPFDALWTARLGQMEASLLHGMGLISQALEASERGLVTARASANPTAVILALHHQGVVLERTDGPRTQRLYLQVVDLIDVIEGAPPHAQDELDAIRGVASFNSHLLSNRTGLPLLPGTPTLHETEERLAHSWPHLAAAIRAFRGLDAHEDGDLEAAREILSALPDPRTIFDAPRSVIVATGVTVFLMLEGRHDEALAVADDLLDRMPPEYVPEALTMKAKIHADAGDFKKAYETAWEIVDTQSRLYGAETMEATRALEVLYRTAEHQEAADAARRQSEAIASQAEAWLQSSLRDPLTDLWNRRYLDKHVEEFAGTAGHQVAVIDVDRFKEVNDRFGHAVGDESLRLVAGVLRSACSPGDVIARPGGDEFAVLRPACVEGSLAESLAPVCRPGCPPGAPQGEITLSIGVAQVGADGVDAAFDRADSAMYDAKRSGGGTVRTA